VKQPSPLDYPKHGLPVFPVFEINIATGACTCGRKPGADCSPGKHPLSALVPHGLSDASQDVTQVKAWIAAWPKANWAVITGAGSGIVVLDVDPRHGGLQSMKDLTGSDVPGPAWGTDLIQRTPSGGYHLLFKHPDKLTKNRVGIRPGLDIRGDGGYIMVAPSNHATDGVYDGVYEWLNGKAWLNGSGPSPAPPMPKYLINVLAEREFAPVLPDVIPDGERDNTMTSLAGTMRRRGMTPEGVLAGLRVENQTRCRPPLEDGDLRRIANQARGWTPDDAQAQSSWLPIDNGPILDGDLSALEPTHMKRIDGQPLLYAERVSDFHGEPETGKSFAAQVAAAEVLQDGGTVLYLDFESEPRDVFGHLLALGVGKERIRAGFRYVRPEAKMTTDAIDDLVTEANDLQPGLTVIDGVNNAMAESGYDSNSNKDVPAWAGRLVRPLAKATPGPTLLIDHVAKNAATRGEWAVGAGQKKAWITGASFGFELVRGEYFGKGRTGAVRIVLQKDKLGALRGKQGAGKVIAILRLTSHEKDGHIDHELLPPPQGEGTGTDGKDWRPTGLMEKISRLLEKSSVALSQTAIESGVVGTAAYKRIALSALIEGEYVERSPGPRNALLHRSVKTYRDPASMPPADYEVGHPI
jgi:hypothetical protein